MDCWMLILRTHIIKTLELLVNAIFSCEVMENFFFPIHIIPTCIYTCLGVTKNSVSSHASFTTLSSRPENRLRPQDLFQKRENREDFLLSLCDLI